MRGIDRGKSEHYNSHPKGMRKKKAIGNANPIDAYSSDRGKAPQRLY